MDISTVDCRIYRGIGSLLICISVLTIIIIIRYSTYYCRCQQRRVIIRQISFVLIGMLLSSIILIVTVIPVLLIQCFNCRPIQSHTFICRFNGFICFFTGTFNMYMLAFLSLCRYLSIFHKHSSLNRLLERNQGLNVLFCGLIALCWSLQPLFNIASRFTSEGLGFHCSLDWNNPAFHSRLFILSLLICNYLFVLFFLIYTNFRIYFMLRTLIRKYKHCYSLPLSIIFRWSKDHTSSSSHLTNCSLLRKYQSNMKLDQNVNRLKFLKIDQHYARITAVLVIQFIFTWSPYALMALLTVYGRIEFIHENKILFSISALFAKMSILLNPLILIYTNKMPKY